MRRREDFFWGIFCTIFFGAVVFFYTPLKLWVATWLPTVFMWGGAAVLLILAVVFFFNGFLAVSDEREEDHADDLSDEEKAILKGEEGGEHE